MIGAQRECQSVLAVQIVQDIGMERAVEELVVAQSVAHVERDELRPARGDAEHGGQTVPARSAHEREQVAHIARPDDRGIVVAQRQQIVQGRGEVGRIERQHYAYFSYAIGGWTVQTNWFSEKSQ